MEKKKRREGGGNSDCVLDLLVIPCPRQAYPIHFRHQRLLVPRLGLFIPIDGLRSEAGVGGGPGALARGTRALYEVRDLGDFVWRNVIHPVAWCV